MPRSVDKIQHITLILHLYGVGLDGNATLLLQVHIVKHLALSNFYSLRVLQKTVCQSTFPMVYMGYDTEITYIIHAVYALGCKVKKKIANHQKNTKKVVTFSFER